MEGVKDRIIGVVRACEAAFLSTINLDDFPETRALDNVLNMEVGDGLGLCFPCDSDSPKVEQLKRNNNASLYYYVVGSWKNMILFGESELVTDRLLKDRLWRADFLQYWKNGKEDEKYGILGFVPTGYKYYPYEDGDVSCSPKVGSL